MLEMVGPCVICTAFSLAWSIGFCAKATGAESISPKPNSISVRFIFFFPSKKNDLNDFRDESGLTRENPQQRQACADSQAYLVRVD
jgi:hypothetical protein